MATFLGATALQKNYNGTHGNASRAALAAAIAAAAVNDDVVLGTFDAGTTIDEIRINHGALGAGVTVDLGYRYVGGEAGSDLAAFGAGLSMAAAAVKRFEAGPVKLLYRAQIVATIKTGPATGSINLLAEYRFEGVSHA